MPIAAPNTRGVSPANLNGAVIPEIAAAPNVPLDVLGDIHFGLNVTEATNAVLYADLDRTIQTEADLVGLGARTIDIKRRGGRTAEDDWFIAQGRGRARATAGLDRPTYTAFNQPQPISNVNFPAGARLGGADVSGTPKYPAVPPTNRKVDARGLQMGTRWSKTALEYALAHGTGNIHFHLDGMGNLAGVFDKTGAYGFNVTSRELRYVQRFWKRFQNKVIFYNGYNGALLPVIVVPPWIASWRPDSTTTTCHVCHQPFSRAFPIRWRHHCRLCGENVCDDCSPTRTRLTFPVMPPGEASSPGVVRVCTPCFQVFDRGVPAPI